MRSTFAALAAAPFALMLASPGAAETYKGEELPELTAQQTQRIIFCARVDIQQFYKETSFAKSLSTKYKLPITVDEKDDQQIFLTLERPELMDKASDQSIHNLTKASDELQTLAMRGDHIQKTENCALANSVNLHDLITGVLNLAWQDYQTIAINNPARFKPETLNILGIQNSNAVPTTNDPSI